MMNFQDIAFLKRLVLILAMLFGLSSCYILKSPEKRIAENRKKVEEEFQKELFFQQEGAKSDIPLNITWKQGVEKMFMHNPELLQADFRVEDAIDNQKRVFTNLIPLLSIGVSNNFELRNIDEAFDDVRLRVYSYLPLGDILRMPKQIYTGSQYQ